MRLYIVVNHLQKITITIRWHKGDMTDSSKSLILYVRSVWIYTGGRHGFWILVIHIRGIIQVTSKSNCEVNGIQGAANPVSSCILVTSKAM